METVITIQNLIQYFENRIKQIESHSMGSTVGSEPQYPMLVVYLGQEAINSHQTIASNLFQVWPQYQQEIRFLGVKGTGNNQGYLEMIFKNGKVSTNNIEDNAVGDTISALFGTKTHFSDRSKLFVYFILDTTSFTDPSEFEEWVKKISDVKTSLGINMLDVLDMLIVLLNENFSRQETSNQIRNMLSSYYDKRSLYSNSSILVLSNRRSDNAILEDWNICYGIISAIIEISNNKDARITGNLFNYTIITASYAREEKPSSKIGQIMVKELIDILAEEGTHKNINSFDDESLRSKLGLTKDGTLVVLDQYAEKNLLPLLPDEKQLELFPRRDYKDHGWMVDLSERDFNELTLNAWECYLNQTVKHARDKVNMDSSTRNRWIEEYSGILLAGFSTEELVYLSNHISEVKKMLETTRKPSSEVKVLRSAIARLKYMLSSDSELIEIFTKIIVDRGEQARIFREAWAKLIQSRLSVFAIRDKNITMFYEKKARNYFDFHENELRDSFKHIADMDGLRIFLEEALNKIIDSDPVYSAPFEEELESRLSEDALVTDAKQYIRKKLTGEDVYTYFQSNFNFGQPLLSAILLKTGTPLYNNLYTNLPPTTYYYDTGQGNAAESLVVYEVTKQNLIN